MDDLLLRDFESRLDEVESYWNHLAVSARIRETARPPVDNSESPPAGDATLSPGLRKVFDYASVIVALYGSVEDYVERLVEHCTVVLQRSADGYSKLPSALRKHHERLSIRLADQISQSSYRGVLNLQSVADNLSDCLADRNPFQLNTEAFAIHGANIRRDIVREMFSRLAIDQIDQAVESHHQVVSLMSELGRDSREIFHYLNDLAARRNVVAHGERPQDVISVGMMPEYFKAIRAFGAALFDSALVGLLNHITPKKLVSLGVPTAVYQAGRVVCFEAIGPLKLRIGDRILWHGKIDRWRTGRVGSLQINSEARESIECAAAGLRFGVGMPVKAIRECEYWLVERW